MKQAIVSFGKVDGNEVLIGFRIPLADASMFPTGTRMVVLLEDEYENLTGVSLPHQEETQTHIKCGKCGAEMQQDLLGTWYCPNRKTYAVREVSLCPSIKTGQATISPVDQVIRKWHGCNPVDTVEKIVLERMRSDDFDGGYFAFSEENGKLTIFCAIVETEVFTTEFVGGISNDISAMIAEMEAVLHTD